MLDDDLEVLETGPDRVKSQRFVHRGSCREGLQTPFAAEAP